MNTMPGALKNGDHLLGLELDLNAQRGEHVGAAAARSERAVPVFGDACASSGGEECGGRGDIEGHECAAARSAGIDHGPALGRCNGDHGAAQSAYAASDVHR